MKFTCQKTELNKAINNISRAMSSNNTNVKMEILKGIYIETKENSIELRSSDMELSIITKIKAEIEEAGSVTISGKTLQDVIKTLPDELVTINYDMEKNLANIKSGTANFNIITIKGTYPEIEIKEPEYTFKIKNKDLKELIKKTAFACSKNDKRPVFTGCLMEIKNDEIIMVGTDTHKLAAKKINLPSPLITKPKKIIIPAKALNEIIRLNNTETEEDIEINYSKTRISLIFNNINLITRLIEGNFPDYTKVIPQEFKITVTINKKDFLNAIDRVSVIARHNEYKNIKLEFIEDKIKISSKDQTIGCSEETITAEKTGEDLTISYNFEYITEILKNLETENIIMSLNETNKPATLKEPTNETTIYVVTPVRTTN